MLSHPSLDLELIGNRAFKLINNIGPTKKQVGMYIQTLSFFFFNSLGKNNKFVALLVL